MSRFYPHSDYAEDQPLGHTILAVHVLTRAVTTGAVIGSGIFGAQELARRVRKSPAPPPLPRSQLFLRAAGASTVWTVGFLSVGLAARMWGREDIEWRDRSWRLLENQGQLETDDWTYGGMALGLLGTAAAAAQKGSLAALGWRGVVGGVGVGSVAGTVGYMAWRYGVHGGKFPEK